MDASSREWLRRLQSDPRLVDPAPARRRRDLRHLVRSCDRLRRLLGPLGVDPAAVGCLAEGEAAAAELAAIPDGAELQQADAACLAANAEFDFEGDDPRLVLLEKIMRMRVNSGHPLDRSPDFPTAHLFEVYAWCLSQPSRGDRAGPAAAEGLTLGVRASPSPAGAVAATDPDRPPSPSMGAGRGGGDGQAGL